MKKFSLMELLVVMGILLLMMSLLLPVVAPMMNRAELNKLVSTISNQLEVGYLKSFEKGQVTRVSFEYDPKGKNIPPLDTTPSVKVGTAEVRSVCLQTITGINPVTLDNELEARRHVTGIGFDINNDGVSGGYVNSQFFWLKAYLCVEDYANDGVNNTHDKIAALDVDGIIGPFWFRRPISRSLNASGKFVQTTIEIKPVWDPGKNKKYYYRFVKNEGLDTGGPEKLITSNMGVSLLIDDKNEKVDYNKTLSEIKTYNGLLNVTYDNSVAMYKTKAGERLKFLYGLTYDQYKTNPVNFPKAEDQQYNVNTEWFDVLEGDYVDPKALDFGFNDDEDKMIDEGMSISVESYNQTDLAPQVILNRDAGVNVQYLNYFSGIEDHNMKIGREYFVGGKDKKGMMLRRVWGVKAGKLNKVLLWSFNSVVVQDVGSEFGSLVKATPFYFYVIFDRKNGRSGMSFGTSFGSEQVDKLYFEVSDDDFSLFSIIEFSDGITKEGDLKEMGFPDLPGGKAALEALGFYLGAK